MDDIKFMNDIVIEKHQKVSAIQFKTEKMNVLSYSLRADLYQAIQKILDDSSVQAIVLVGTEHCFSAGADITEFSIGTHTKFPSLHDLIDLISDAHKPIIAAISGVALGGGLELALACHHRVVHEKAKLALPEVNLGLLPGAGGTQLLPRYIGSSLALNNILSGKPFDLNGLKDTALIDVMT